MVRQAVTFQDVLETVESLPENQQEDLIDIVRRRLLEHRREQLAQSVKKGKKEFVRGEVKKGNVDDLLRDISK